MAEGILLIISGPSGVGKGTVCRRLLEIRKELKVSVSYTTRPPRHGEIDGREYNFIDRESFEAMINKDAFLEWAVVHGYYYGTRRVAVEEALSHGEDLILEIDVQGATQVRVKMPESVSVFLAPPSMKVLEERIDGRGTEDEQRIKDRLATARREMKVYHRYDYVVVNETVEKAASLINSIIDVEKCRVSRGARPPDTGGDSS
ncbi:MAG: guanylate kinase [Bacillota bacterium]|nr:guanylate kinase [Bacillota bacterium]